MALTNPLSEFNRHNPFVIKAKRQYTVLMNEYESLSKDFLITTATAVVTAVVSILVCIIGCLVSGAATLIPTLGIFLFIGFCEWICWKILTSRIQDPDNSKMDEMSSIEMNEVAEVNIEFVYELINIIYSLQGRVYSARKFMEAMRFIIGLVSITYFLGILALAITH